MENISEFDLNNAIRRWLERLGQSPQVKAENLRELESHVRDSMSKLEGKGLSAEETFIVATHRIGSPEKLEPEFAKVNRNPWNLIIHALILAFFSLVCWFMWGILHLPQMTSAAMHGRQLPAFTRLIVGCGNFLMVPPLLALIYCLSVWLRKASSKNSWVGLFAATTAVLILLTIPTMIAVLLPMIQFMGEFAAK